MSKNNVIAKYWGTILVSLFMLTCIVYVGYNGQDIAIQIFDNLDSNIAWLKMLKDNNLFFDYSSKVPFLHGIDRIYLYSPLKAYVWLYIAFPVFWAFIIGWLLKVIVSVFGFIYLGKILKLDTDDFNKNIIIFCGFLYGITPTFPTMVFEFASLPFLLGWLIKFYKAPSKKFDLLFLIYSIFSSFCFFGIFILFYLAVFVFIDALVNKKIKYYMFRPIIYLIIGYVITEWNLFYLMLFSGEQTIRQTMSWTLRTNDISFIFYQIKKAFLEGQYHAASVHNVIVLPVSILYFFYLLAKKRTQIYKDYYFWIIVVIVLNCIFFGLDSCKLFRDFISFVIPPLSGWAISRFLWLNPFLCYLAFTVVLCKLKLNFRYIVDLKILICIFALSALFGSEDIYNIIKYNYDYQINKHQNLSIRRGKTMQDFIDTNKEISYQEFYSENLFNKIKKSINYSGQWSIAYGFHPAVLQYNQIKTIDGFLSYYPLKYKEEFRKLIAPRLEVMGDNNFYDRWGGRAYIFSEDYAYHNINLRNNQTHSELLINMDEFKYLEGKYVFSRFIISNAEDLNLKYVNTFKDDSSPYIIYLYEI